MSLSQASVHTGPRYTESFWDCLLRSNSYHVYRLNCKPILFQPPHQFPMTYNGKAIFLAMSYCNLALAVSPTSSLLLLVPYHSPQRTSLTFLLFLARMNFLSSQTLHFLFLLPGMHISLCKVGCFLSFRSLHKRHNCKEVFPDSSFKGYPHPPLHHVNVLFF